MILLFPCNNEIALKFCLNQCAPIRNKLLFACENPSELDMLNFNAVVNLANIYSPEFNKQLSELFIKHKIEFVFVTLSIAYEYLKMHFSEKVNIINISNGFHEHTNHFSKIDLISKKLYGSLTEATRKNVSFFNIRELIYSSERICGETALSKIIYLVSLFDNLPPGDVLELGVLFGKCANALAYLNALITKGKFYLIDPWNGNEAIQNESPDALAIYSRGSDFNLVHECFITEQQIGLHLRNALVHRGTINTFYQVYKNEPKCIFAHIDGNHDYQAVTNDLEIIYKYMLPGGIIACDDYHWIHGGGVKMAVAEFKEKNTNNIRKIEVVEKTAYIYLK